MSQKLKKFQINHKEINFITVVIILISITFIGSSVNSQEYPLQMIIQKGHSDVIGSGCFSSDGRYLVTGSGDKTAILWDVFSGREIRVFEANGVSDVCFTPNGKYIVTGNRKEAALWSISSGRKIRSFKEVVLSVCVSPTGKYILTGNRDNTAKLWDINSGRMVRVFKGHSTGGYSWSIKGDRLENYKVDGVTSVDFSPDGKYIVTGAYDNTAKLWEVSSGREIYTFSGHSWDKRSSRINSVCFSPDGRYIVTAGFDNSAILWHTGSGNKIYVLEHSYPVYFVKISPNGKCIITGAGDGTRIWNISTGQEIKFEGRESGLSGFLKKILGKSSLPRISRSFDDLSPDGKYVVTTGKTIKIWDIATGHEIRTFQGQSQRSSNVSFCPGGKYIITSGYENNARLWDLNIGRQVRSYNLSEQYSIDVSPDGRYLATGHHDYDKTVRLWDFSTGDEIRAFKRKRFFNTNKYSVVTCLSFSPDGRYIVTGSPDKTAKLWEVETGRGIRSFEGHSHRINSISFSPDGKTFITGSWDVTAILWDVSTGHKMFSLQRQHMGPIGYCPGGHTEIIMAVSFSPDGKTVITGSGDCTTKLWDVSTKHRENRLLRTFKGHKDVITSLKFNPDGRIIVTGSQDNTAKIWNVSTGRLIHNLKDHSDHVTDVDFSQDGSYIVTGSHDNTCKIWHTKTGKLILTLISIDENDWFVKTPEDLFDCSEGAKKYIHFVKGLEVYELDQFFEDFYRPGLLAQVLSGEEIRLPQITIANKISNSPPPKVEIISPNPGESLTRQDIEVKVKVSDTGGGIDEMKLLHNGKRVSEDGRGIGTVDIGERGDIIRSYHVSLVKGENTLIASAFSKGRVESRGYKLVILFEGPSKTAVSHILAVGINQYKNSSNNLNYARADAEGFVDLVIDKSKKLFKDINLFTLYDTDATKNNVLLKLDEIARQSKPEDVFTFYFAGHGSFVDNRFYLVTSENARLYDRSQLDENAIDAKSFQEKLQNINALKQLVIIDACQAGAALEHLAFRGAAEEKALAQLARSAGVCVLASSGTEQFANEFHELGHGVFTYALLEGLKGEADGIPHDGKITIYELKTYLDDRVPELTKKYKGESQYPNTFSYGQDFPLIIK